MHGHSPLLCVAGTMADVTDPELRETVDLVKSDGTEVDWCAFGYEG